MNELFKQLNAINQIDISYTSIIFSIIISVFCSYIIKEAYVRYGKSLNNRRNFSNSFILLGVTTSIIITVVKFSFALSLGLVGALSIVRFRAAIRDPEELVYLFLIIGIGISSGANQYMVTIFLTFSALVIILFQEKIFVQKNIKTDSINLIQLNCQKKDYEKIFVELNKIFQKYTKLTNLKSMTSNEKEVELSFEFLLIDNLNSKKFSEEINKITSGSTTITIISNVLIPD